MGFLPHIFRTKSFWLCAGAIFLAQFILLLLATPMYEIDTNSFVRGGLTWSIYHNPFLNIFIAVANKLWQNLWFLLSLQIAFYGLAASGFIHVLFSEKRWIRIAVVIAALEPVTLFYNFSLLAESFYTSFILLALSGLILWLRSGAWKHALLFGGMMGLAFLCKLSAVPMLALYGLFVFRTSSPWRTRLTHTAVAALPFICSYFFVNIGQGIINEGALYTVAGRVAWDFSCTQYNPDEIEGDAFKRYMHPAILESGKLISNRELRRERGYVAHKQCIAENGGGNSAILYCDSIWGAVAKQILSHHFWECEAGFIRENIWSILHYNYLEYRFTPNLVYYHPPTEYSYIDSLMKAGYGYSLPEHAQRIPVIWRDLRFTNIYMPLMWVAWAAVMLWSAFRWLRHRRRWELLVISATLSIPLLFHLVYISYRPRFLAPYLVMMLLLWLVNIASLKKQQQKSA